MYILATEINNEQVTKEQKRPQINELWPALQTTFN